MTKTLHALRAADPFAALLPSAVARMPIVWHQMRIPGPPLELELTAAERDAPSLRDRFARRTIQELIIAPRCAANGHAPAEPGRRGIVPEDTLPRLALIDKASPHALFDLMLCEVTPADDGRFAGSDPGTASADLAQLLWTTAANFHRFVSDPSIRSGFGLGGGRIHFALNCDPLTRDRESVQALKRFHLHLIYWRAAELAPVQPAHRFGDQTARYLARQCLDPMSFVGSAVLNEVLGAPDREVCDGDWLMPEIGALCEGRFPLGALAQIASWDRLAAPEFEQLIRRLHGRISATVQALQRAFTGTAAPPAPWSRHRLLPDPRIAENLQALGLSAESGAQLLALARRLRNLSPRSARRLQQASPAQRQHCMTLNQPCYSLCLSPFPATGTRLPAAEPEPPLLSVQPKLFSGIGGAGLLSLPGRPSVRVVRGQGRFSSDDWRRRVEFQRRFAAFNTAVLQQTAGLGAELQAGPVHELQDLGAGWTL